MIRARIFVGVFVGVLLGSLSPAAIAPASAVTCIWTGSAGNTLWSNSQNWTNCRNAVPENGDSLRFPDAVRNARGENDLSGLVIESIDITGSSSAETGYRIMGNPIVLRNTLTMSVPNGGRAASIELIVRLGGHVGIDQTAPGGPQLAIDEIDLAGFSATLDVRRVTENGALAVRRISGTGAVTKLGAGTLDLGGGSTYVGTTLILAGTVIANSPSPFGNAHDAERTIVAAGAQIVLSGAGLAEPLTIGGTGSDGRGALRVMNSVVFTYPGPIALAADATIGVHDAATLVLAGPVTAGAFTVHKTGTGTLALANPGNQWRRLEIGDGEVRLDAAGALPDSAPVAIGIRQELDLNGFSETVGGLEDFGLVRLHGATLTVSSTTSTYFSGTLEGTGGLTKTGPGTFTVGGISPGTYTGMTRVEAGTLTLDKPAGAGLGSLTIAGGIVDMWRADQIDDAAAVTVDAPGQLHVRANDVIGSLAGSGEVWFAGAADDTNYLSVGANDQSTVFSGMLTGEQSTLPLRKVGHGSLTLTGRSTFTGRTRIENGTLIVHGSLNPAGTVLVDSGTLGGNGTVGRIAGSSDATTALVAPGASPGRLSATDATLNGPLVIEIDGPAPGAGYDQLRLTGTLRLDSNARLRVASSFTARKGAQFTIVSGAQAIQGTFARLPEGAELDVAGQRFRLNYTGGAGHDVVLTALDGPAELTYYLAEGATGTFFDEDILLANPNDAEAPVTLTFFKDSGETVTIQRTLAPQSHGLLHVDDLPGLEAAVASLRVTSTTGQELFVERTMFWNGDYYAGHTGSALSEPAADWYFAEGAQGFFDTFVLIVNPNDAPADVTLTFLRENDTPVVKTLPIAAHARLTVSTAEIAELNSRAFGIAVHGTQPIMAERAMYFASTPGRLWGGGHESAGVTAPSTSWYLAEGATGFFDTFILLSNPQKLDAQVTVRFLLATGETIDLQKTVLASGRLTISPEAEEDARLRAATFSTVITSDVPIVAERSMYWAAATTPWGEAHNAFGVVSASVEWGLAEGRVGGDRVPFSTYILLANPQSTEAQVSVRFLRETGPPITREVTVPATGRFTLDASTIEELRGTTFGAHIISTNGVPIVVERSMYWDAGGVFWSGGTNAVGIGRW